MSPSAEAFKSEKSDPSQGSSEPDRTSNPPLNSQLSGVMGSLWRLANLQFSIWLTRTKMAVVRILLLIMLMFLALVLAVIGVIFLYAGVYHVLTDLLHIPTVWALLIFAGAHLLVAGIFAAVAIRLINSHKRPRQESGVET